MQKINKILSDFEDYIKKSIDIWQVPGVVVGIAKNNEIIYQKAFGVKKLGNTDQVNVQTVFQVGSITKAFTATLMAILVTEGKINWQDKVIDFLPEFRMYDPWVTREFMIEDLFTHRTGLPPSSGMNLLNFDFDQKHLIKSLRYIKPISSFRSTFCYQNLPYIVAGKIIENITGKSWEENLQERIFMPLDIKNAFVSSYEFCRTQNIAYLHKTQNGSIVSVPMNWKYHDWLDKIGAGGAISTNVANVLRWLNFQMGYNNDKILPEKVIRELHKPIVTATNNQLLLLKVNKWQETLQYGLGWISSDFSPHRIVYHAGGTLGHSTMAAFIPEEKLAIAVLTNSKNLLIFSLLRDFYDRYFEKNHSDWNKILYDEFQKNKNDIEIPLKTTVHNLELKRYVGSYYNDIYHQAAIQIEGEFLVLTLGVKKTRFTLQPWNNTCFLLEWDGGKHTITPTFFDKPDFVTFEYDNFERVKSMTITLLNDFDGLGVFNKTQ